MLNNKITDKFFNSNEGFHKVEDLKILDMLISGCEIVGIEKSFTENDCIPGVNIYFRNGNEEILALQINPFTIKENNIDIAVFLCTPDLNDETEKNQESSWDNIPHLTDER